MTSSTGDAAAGVSVGVGVGVNVGVGVWVALWQLVGASVLAFVWNVCVPLGKLSIVTRTLLRYLDAPSIAGRGGME